MLKLIYDSRLFQLVKQRNRYIVFAMGLLVTNFIQTLIIFCMIGNWHTVVVPAGLSKTFWVSHSDVSESYLSEMTQYFAGLALNISPDNAAYQRDAILKYTDPASYGRLKNQFIANEDHLKQNNLTTSFYPVDIQVDTQQLTAKITGDLKSYVGSQLTSSVRQTYLAMYTYHHGRLLISQFSEINNNAN